MPSLKFIDYLPEDHDLHHLSPDVVEWLSIYVGDQRFYEPQYFLEGDGWKVTAYSVIISSPKREVKFNLSIHDLLLAKLFCLTWGGSFVNDRLHHS